MSWRGSTRSSPATRSGSCTSRASGGIGKSTLLRAMGRRAVDAGYAVVTLDGRDLQPFPSVLNDSARAGDDQRPHPRRDRFLRDDQFARRVAPRGGHPRPAAIPRSSCSGRGSVRHPAGSRAAGTPCSNRWSLTGLSAGELRLLAQAHGVPEPTVDAIVRPAHGSPLAIVVGAETGPAGSIGELVDRLIGDEVDSDRYRMLSVASLARVTTPELLEAVLGDRSVRRATSGWPTGPSASRLRRRRHPARARRRGGAGTDRATTTRWARRPSDAASPTISTTSTSGAPRALDRAAAPRRRPRRAVGVRLRRRQPLSDRPLRAGDVDRIGSILDAVGLDEWWEVTTVFFPTIPSAAAIARDGDGRVGGYFIAVSPASAGGRRARSAARAVAALCPRRARPDERRPVARGGRPDGRDGRGHLTARRRRPAATGVVNPRYGFLPISPLVPGRAFSEALGAVHVPALDMHGHGMDLACHVVDFGPGGLIGFQRDWIYRETGSAVPAGRG